MELRVEAGMLEPSSVQELVPPGQMATASGFGHGCGQKVMIVAPEDAVTMPWQECQMVILDKHRWGPKISLRDHRVGDLRDSLLVLDQSDVRNVGRTWAMCKEWPRPSSRSRSSSRLPPPS